MSLINDALKKAQNQHAPGAGATGAPPPLAVSPRSSSKPGRTVVFTGGLIFVLTLAALVLIKWGLKSLKKEEASAKPAMLAATEPPASAKVSEPGAPDASPPAATMPESSPQPPSPLAQARSAVASHAALRQPLRELAAEGSEPGAPSADKPTAAAAMKAAPIPSEGAAATPPPPARPDPKTLALVDSLKVTGIRAADGKAMINGRTVRLHDVVDHANGLKLTKLEPDRLTFQDERGVAYTRTF